MASGKKVLNMTLILAVAAAEHSIILAADARRGGGKGPPPYPTHEKMFVRTEVGILTSGFAPQGVDVPSIIQSRLPANASLDTAISFICEEFS